jgi:hypothetical protein
MHTFRSRRGGFALVTAIFAIVIIGALVAGVFVASTQEYRIGRNAVLQSRATAAAEYGLRMTSAPPKWQAAKWNLMKQGGVDSMAWAMPASAGSVPDSAKVYVTAISKDNFLVVSESRVGRTRGATSRQRLALFTTLMRPVINLRGALTTRGVTKIGGSSQIDGTDNQASGWSCPAPGAALPGVATNDTSQLSLIGGCSGYGCINGNPRVKQDPLAGDTSTYFNFGAGNSWETLKQSAKWVNSDPVGPSYNMDGSCNINDIRNWGDIRRSTPAGACESYFPIIYSSGHLSLSSASTGQGILLVDGDLTITGGFTFYGPVIVRGTFSTQGSGGKFYGGVMAANVNLQQNSVLGNAVAIYSSCVMAQVMGAIAKPDVIAERPWVRLP